MNLNQVTMPAADMAESTRFYRRMGFVQIVDTPHYARFECPQGDSTFSLALQDAQAGSCTTIYFEDAQLDRWVAELVVKGFQFDQPPTDQRYLWREAVLRDPAGNQLKLYSAGTARKHPPWRVERRDP